MKKIMVMRHADAVTTEPGSDMKDIDRPLSEKGIEETKEMAKELKELDLMPDLVYVSPAKRTQETLNHLLPKFPKKKIITDDMIYQATANQLYEMIRLQEKDPDTILIIGHNPNIHGFAMFLADPKPKNFDFKDFSKGFVPGALAVLQHDGDFWVNVMPAQNELINYLRPEVPDIKYRKA